MSLIAGFHVGSLFLDQCLTGYQPFATVFGKMLWAYPVMD